MQVLHAFFSENKQNLWLTNLIENNQTKFELEFRFRMNVVGSNVLNLTREWKY